MTRVRQGGHGLWLVAPRIIYKANFCFDVCSHYSTDIWHCYKVVLNNELKCTEKDHLGFLELSSFF